MLAWLLTLNYISVLKCYHLINYILHVILLYIRIIRNIGDDGVYLVRTGADGGQVCIAFVVVVVVVKFIVVKVVVITTIADHLRYFTRQLFRQFRSDQFISKLSIIVAVY